MHEINKLIEEIATETCSVIEATGPWVPPGTPVDGWTFDRAAMAKFSAAILEAHANKIQEFVDYRFPASEYPERLRKHFG
jgi:hypothetical protein